MFTLSTLARWGMGCTRSSSAAPPSPPRGRVTSGPGCTGFCPQSSINPSNPTPTGHLWNKLTLRLSLAFFYVGFSRQNGVISLQTQIRWDGNPSIFLRMIKWTGSMVSTQLLVIFLIPLHISWLIQHCMIRKVVCDELQERVTARPGTESQFTCTRVTAPWTTGPCTTVMEIFSLFLNRASSTSQQSLESRNPN